MFGLLIAAVAISYVAAILAFYYNYIARYHRVQVFGERRKIRYPRGVVPLFDLPDLLIDKDEYRLMRLVKLRKLPVAVCLGDSITHGIVSTDYVAMLQERFQARCVFVNSGINGNLAFNLRARLAEDCIEYDPDYITVLIGTNDVNSRSGGKALRNYQRFQGLSVVPDEEYFVENLRGIFESIKTRTSARVAVLSLPVIGEDPASAPNELARAYSSRIKYLASEFGFTYLPLNEAQNTAINAKSVKENPARAKRWFLLNVLLMLRKSFDRIAEIQGRILTYDGLHMTSRGASMIEELIGGWLDTELKASGGKEP